MTIGALIRRAHLWVGLLLGAQALLWMISGVIMSWLQLSLVRGETTAFSPPPPELQVSTYASPGGVIAQVEGATSVELRSFLGRAVYEVRGAGGAALFDAATAERLSPISEETARAVAEQDFIGEGEIAAIALMDNPPSEYRGAVPVWRADFDDRLRTRLYISPRTGAVAARRNAVWRVHDVFRMLHVMDYGEEGNANNPLLRAASAAALVFAVSGLAMLGFRSSRRVIGGDLSRLLRRKRAEGRAPRL